MLDHQHTDGSWSRQERETYDRGDGGIVDAKTIMLLYWLRDAALMLGSRAEVDKPLGPSRHRRRPPTVEPCGTP